jgi:hypothetical protein
MTSRRTHRTSDLQPELPLPSAAAPPGRSEARRAPRPAEWRLDEHTKQIGRQGVAAARAALRSHPAPDRGPHPAGDRDRTGRAA